MEGEKKNDRREKKRTTCNNREELVVDVVKLLAQEVFGLITAAHCHQEYWSIHQENNLKRSFQEDKKKRK